MDTVSKPLCNKCSKTVTLKVYQCATCLRHYHPNCLQKYTAVKDARACCSASYIAMRSQSSARRKSDRQALDRSLSRASIFDSSRSFVNSRDNPIESHLATASASAPVSQLRQSATNLLPNSSNQNVDEQFNQYCNLPLDQKMNVVLRQLLNQNNELLEIKSQLHYLSDTIVNHEERLASLETGRADDRALVDEKLANTKQALAYTQHQKSLAEVIIGGIPVESSLSELEIAHKVLQKIDASKYLDDIIFAKKRTFKKHTNSSINTSELPKFYSIIVRFKSENIRNEVIRLKKLYGDIPAVEIFPELPNSTKERVIINEWLQSHMYKLLQLTRQKAKNMGYERVWIYNEVISVRKNASSPKIEIFSEADLELLV